MSIISVKDVNYLYMTIRYTLPDINESKLIYLILEANLINDQSINIYVSIYLFTAEC